MANYVNNQYIYDNIVCPEFGIDASGTNNPTLTIMWGGGTAPGVYDYQILRGTSAPSFGDDFKTVTGSEGWLFVGEFTNRTYDLIG